MSFTQFLRFLSILVFVVKNGRTLNKKDTHPLTQQKGFTRKISQDDLKFLLESIAAISSSLDYQITLNQIANLAVPKFADWCSIHIVDKDSVPQQIIVAHVDPKKVEFAKRLQEDYPPDDSDEQGVNRVIKTGASEMMAEIPEKMLLASAKDKEHEKIIKALQIKSYMCVPLIARERVLGAITFIGAESGRRYSENDLLLVEDLAKVVGIAIENAQLFQEIQVEVQRRKEAEDQLLKLNQDLEQKVLFRTAQLQRSNSELQDFAYVASHDLQEPLRKIQAFGDLLKEEYGDKLEGGRDYLDRMLNASFRMRKLIDDLLAFSRVTTKGLPFASTDLGQIVQEVLLDLEVQIKELHAEIIVQTLPVIEADPMQMRQLFQNLIGNALKFHRKDQQPKLKIYSKMRALDDTHPMVEIFVEDNGIGFDVKYLDKIFTIFERLNPKKDYEGTGIGLAVCRKIVQRHGGMITAKSIQKKGTTFIVTLPMKQKRGVSV